ncbi:hypothetical protein PLICRDRAFT_39194 [Plicaturopsis crispa FD-325 SS-3]|nr:hypothetical protein PLICRDRAFT_39194 [Plicaturopsis crispa FD-325 SS-3]
MSSDENETTNGQALSSVLVQERLKKRRIEQACDLCRQRKIRCDGPIAAGHCLNCTTAGTECTYDKARKKRRRPKAYVEDIERRLETLESLLKAPRPRGDFSRALDFAVHPSWFTLDHRVESASNDFSSVTTPSQSTRSPSDAIEDSVQDTDNFAGSDDDDTQAAFLAERMDLMHLNERFFGKSSGIRFIQRVQKAKDELGGISRQGPPLPHRRARFWNMASWEQFPFVTQQCDFRFPEADLMASLVDLYFTRTHAYLPFLHRPTFERGIATELHLRDSAFGATVLLVCALGSKFSSDPRVLLENTNDLSSAGWRWFNQVQSMRKSIFLAPRIYDLQLFILCILFLQGTSAPQAGWVLIGIGIRVAEDMGAHRCQSPSKRLTVEDELRKRAFWVLVCLDRNASVTLGRPCVVHDEDFDVDLPVNCDDEYWENADDPDQNFKQPSGRPAATAYFICMLKLNQILALALRTIYSIDKTKAAFGFVGKKWDQSIVAELDSALNKWIDEIPDHLRWDPTREDPLFFNQSASLYASYYHVQMLVHRPFISSALKATPLSFPSFAICTNAARSCAHVVDLQCRRFPDHLPTPNSMPSVASSGIILLLNIWSGKQSGLSIDPLREMADVHKCMAVLKSVEERWHAAGCLWDVLYELATVGDLPVPQPSPPDSKKRNRPSEDNNASAYTFNAAPTGFGAAPVPNFSLAPSLPGNHHSHPYGASPSQHSSSADASMFSLPVTSADLGRIPLHGHLDIDQWNSGINPTEWLPPDLPPSAGSSIDDPLERVFGRDADSFATTLADPLTMDAFISNDPGSAPYQQQEGADDFDITGIWSNAPTSFELDDWGAYIMGMIERE